MVKRMAKHMVPIWAHSIVRGKKQQEAAFAGGFSNARFGKSPHNFGCAVDLVHGTVAWGMDDMAWKILGHIGKEVAKAKGIHIVWGGDWNPNPITKLGWDPAHWELAGWKTLRTEFPWQPTKTQARRPQTLVEALKAKFPTWL